MTPPPDRLMSLNEVETLSAKAARGAGLAWGLSEDVGRAARWMAERGLEWSLPLLRLTGGVAATDRLSPIVGLADLLPGAEPGTRWALDAAVPLWVLAILSGALHGRDLALDLAWTDVRLRLQPDGRIGAAAEPRGLDALGPEAVTVTVAAPVAALADALPIRCRRSRVAGSVLRDLESLCARTYVPASTQSRASGAGGVRVDDD